MATCSAHVHGDNDQVLYAAMADESGGADDGTEEVSYAVLEQHVESGDVVCDTTDTNGAARPSSVGSNLYAVVDKQRDGADDVVYADNLEFGMTGQRPDMEERVEYSAIATDGV